MENVLNAISVNHCLICKDGRKNRCLHWHKDSETGDIWVWCQGKCKRAYSLFDYCSTAGISLKALLSANLTFDEAAPMEVNAISWPRHFHALSDPASKSGVDYLKKRGLNFPGEMYYDSMHDGVVFPYYLNNTFVGAQIRFIEPRVTEDGDTWKITTLPGTRLGYLFWGWSQQPFSTNVKYVVVAEGAINAASLQQSLNAKYGNLLSNPYRCISTSGASISKFHCEKLRELIDSGLKVIAAFDNDDAGIKCLEKAINSGACTHYSVVDQDGKDWNDLLIDQPAELAKYFVSRLKRS